MTTLNAATIATMNRAQVWAYITDNALPVAKKRSTEDARQALADYMESVETEQPAIEIEVEETPVYSETVKEVIAMLTAYSEQPANETEETANEIEQPGVETTATNGKRAAKAVEPSNRIGASIVLVAIIAAIWVVFTQLLIPTAIGIVKLAMVLYRKAATAIGAIGQPPTSISQGDGYANDYFPDLAEVG